jgi:hypothetical protein
MSNTINSLLVDRIYAMGLLALRRQTALLRYVTTYEKEVMDNSFRGDTVVVPIPSQRSDSDVTDVVPSNTPPAPSDITLRYASVTLSNWKKVNFALTDFEVSKLSAGTMSDEFSGAIDVLAGNIIRSVMANYTGIYQYAGTAGTTPFASSTASVASARKLLNISGAPMENRAIILNFDADANSIGLSLFQQYLQKGDTETLMEGTIKRALGFDWAVDGYLPTFTGGTLSNGTGKLALINDASVAVGDTSVPMDSGTLTGTLVVGDLFTVAGDDQQYVVTAAATASSNAIASVSFSPAAKVAWADNAVVTFVASHDVACLALHRQAIAFASKPLDDVTLEGGSQIRQIPDPVSGLTLCLEITRQYKQTVAEFSCLWGSTLARPECAVRILG